MHEHEIYSGNVLNVFKDYFTITDCVIDYNTRLSIGFHIVKTENNSV